ncbi:hypothetical protein Tco_0551770 [Tanacetum coccineum]
MMRVDDLNGQGYDQGMGANGGVDGVNGNVSNQGNAGNQNGNVVNENVQRERSFVGKAINCGGTLNRKAKPESDAV